MYTIGYFAATAYRASRKLFWYDEIITVDVSRLPDFSSIWNTLNHGVDFNPPLFYLLTRISEGAVASEHIGARLPEIIGFWVFTICLFRFVSLRTNALAGFISMLFPLVTTAYSYAYEARPSGIILGCCGLALVTWQHPAAATPRPRVWSLAILFMSLTVALLCHGYAVLLFVPLLFGEMVRVVATRRPDWAMWSTLIVAGTAIFVSVILFRTLQSHVGTFVPASLVTLAQNYQAFFRSGATVLAIVLAVLCISHFECVNHRM